MKSQLAHLVAERGYAPREFPRTLQSQLKQIIAERFPHNCEMYCTKVEKLDRPPGPTRPSLWSWNFCHFNAIFTFNIYLTFIAPFSQLFSMIS